jgi:hypothetical protein
MQLFGCILKKRILPHFSRLFRNAKIGQSFNPQPSYLSGRLISGSGTRTSGGKSSVLVLAKIPEAGSSIPSSRLEQQGQTPGWREEILPGETGSPQQMQAWNSMDPKMA